jgi:hypothetical protein
MTDAMVSKIDGSANIRSVATSSISWLLLGSSGLSRSMVPMPGKSTYRHDAKSVTLSTDEAPVASEGSAPLTLRHRDPPPVGVALSHHPWEPSPRPRHLG